MQLRPYQEQAIQAVYHYLRTEQGNPIISHATGLGKSVICGRLAVDTVAKWNRRVLILTHVKELLVQNEAKIRALWPDAPTGFYCAGLGYREIAPITVASIQSIYKHAARIFPPPDLIIIDEVHRLPNESETMYRKLINALLLQNPKMRIVGLSATPWREKGGLLTEGENPLFHEIVHEYGIADGIRDGWLCPLSTKATIETTANMRGVKKSAGDFNQQEAENRLFAITDSAIQHFQRITDDRQSRLSFGQTVKHAEYIAQLLNAPLITGDTESDEREELLEGFKAGAFRDLVNVRVLTTGFDAPNVDALGCFFATSASGLWLQILGRGTRLHPGKQNCLVADYGGNIERFGPIDEIRPPRAKKKKNDISITPMKMCAVCDEVVKVQVRECPNCGYEFPFKQTVKIEEQASTAKIMNDGEPEWLNVNFWQWYCHEKEGRNSLRIEYWCEGRKKPILEFKFIEHRYKTPFRLWWQWWFPSLPVPETVQQALYAFEKLPRYIKRINVIKKGKYHEIRQYDFTEHTSQNASTSLRNAGSGQESATAAML